MNAFIKHFSFEFRSGIRNKSLMFMYYVFPMSLYLLIGSMMAALNPAFREQMIPSMIVIAMLSATIMNLPGPLLAAREMGILRSYKINGVPAASILLIPVLSSFFHFIVPAAIIAVTAPLLFGAPLPVNWTGFFLILLLTFLTSAGLGLLIGVVSSSPQMVMLLVQTIFIPSMMLGGLMFPHGGLPKTLGKIALLLPTTYAMNAMRGLAQNLPVDLNTSWSILILLISSLLSFGLALYLFKWDIHDSNKLKPAALALLVLLPYVAGMLLL
jgi:ABC-2 type transport system permease protein